MTFLSGRPPRLSRTRLPPANRLDRGTDVDPPPLWSMGAHPNLPRSDWRPRGVLWRQRLSNQTQRHSTGVGDWPLSSWNRKGAFPSIRAISSRGWYGPAVGHVFDRVLFSVWTVAIGCGAWAGGFTPSRSVSDPPPTGAPFGIREAPRWSSPETSARSSSGWIRSMSLCWCDCWPVCYRCRPEMPPREIGFRLPPEIST